MNDEKWRLCLEYLAEVGLDPDEWSAPNWAEGVLSAGGLSEEQRKELFTQREEAQRRAYEREKNYHTFTFYGSNDGGQSFVKIGEAITQGESVERPTLPHHYYQMFFTVRRPDGTTISSPVGTNGRILRAQSDGGCWFESYT